MRKMDLVIIFLILLIILAATMPIFDVWEITKRYNQHYVTLFRYIELYIQQLLGIC